MPDIDAANVITFSNDQIRPAADRLAGAYSAARNILASWGAISSQVPNDSSSVIDGSPHDGRNPIDGSDMHAIIASLQSFVDLMEADSNAGINLATKVAVNPVIHS